MASSQLGGSRQASLGLSGFPRLRSGQAPTRTHTPSPKADACLPRALS